MLTTISLNTCVEENAHHPSPMRASRTSTLFSLYVRRMFVYVVDAHEVQHTRFTDGTSIGISIVRCFICTLQISRLFNISSCFLTVQTSNWFFFSPSTHFSIVFFSIQVFGFGIIHFSASLKTHIYLLYLTIEFISIPDDMKTTFPFIYASLFIFYFDWLNIPYVSNISIGLSFRCVARLLLVANYQYLYINPY